MKHAITARLHPLTLLLMACVSSVSVLPLGGCASSAPVRFYTLSEVPPAEGSGSASSPANALRVARVQLPGELDRSELVQRLDANRLRIAEQDLWAAPLAEQIRRVLTEDLQARMGARSAGPATRSLDLDIDEFVGDTRCAVTLRASWQIRAPGANGAPAASGHETIDVPPPAASACTIGALPGAMSEALARLSERILASRH